MKLNRTNRNVANQTRTSAQQARTQARAACAIDRLEERQLFSVTGFSLVNQSITFPTTNTTVISQPNVFQTTLQQSWSQLTNGQLKLGGQTLAQVFAAGIEQAEQAQGLWGYNIGTNFAQTPSYNGVLLETATGPVVELNFDAIGNKTTFTSTTNTILGSGADPKFNVTYDLDLKVDLAIPTNLASGAFTATASATVSNVNVSTKNILVKLADIFGANIPGKISSAINGQHQDISSIVPTDTLNGALKLEASQGYTHLFSSLSSSSNLVLTAVKPSLVINGTPNQHISISVGLNDQLVVAVGNQFESFGPGVLNSITINEASTGVNSVNILTLQPGIAVQVNDTGTATDSVAVGGYGALSGVAGTVSVNTSSGKTNLTVNDGGDTAASQLTVTNNAVLLNGVNEVTYATTGTGQTALTVEAGYYASTAINSTSAPLSVVGSIGAVTVGNGSLAGIGGPVSIFTSGPVTINDSNDTVGRTVDLSSTTQFIFTSLHNIIRSTTSTVAFEGLANILVGETVTGVTINDGSANNTYNAESSPSTDFFHVGGHFGDTVIGPAADQVDLNLFTRGIPIKFPIKLPIRL